MQTQQPKPLLLACRIYLPVVLPLHCCFPAVHAAMKMLLAINLNCKLPFGIPQIKRVLHTLQQVGLEHSWARLWASLLQRCLGP
jgi:hypothetical protein